MESLTNVTFKEIKVGDTATVTRRLSRPEVEALALVGGDVDAFHIIKGEELSSGALRTEAVGAEALLSGLLNRKLPGPGTSIAAQDLQFDGNVQPGDELVATVTARQKNAKKGLVVFDCRVRSNGHDLITGTVTVRAPERRLHYADVATPQVILRRTDKYAKLLKECEALPPITCVVAHPCDRDSLLGPVEAASLGLIDPILVGPEEKIRAVAKAEGLELSPYRIVATEHSHASAEKAVALVRAGEGEALMKGSLHTDELMGAVVSSATGLRTNRRISHVFLMDVPSHPQALAITDAAINIAPTLEDKMHIAQNVIDLVHVLGVANPKVAILSAVETINPKIPSTLDAAALCKMADRGQITGATLDGPLAFDNAISEAAAKTKKITSPVAGKADILLVPDLEAGNMLAKQLQYLAGADAAGIVLGARVPIVLTSRADNVRTRLASIAVMKLLAHSRRTGDKPVR
ncbi:MAG TPA: bifunctional enoyl-CoA hydratase/phosphate acetyltransferase [Candidatus Limnocylindrales bacterium]|jgi:phosphate acetyltransferase|nr:bifunctional enoyl-CoA hydratase/phosphate acetyltransferase [Candidatus Limnocylindrales bacterium]